MTDGEVIATIFAAFRARGSDAYLGEPVSLSEHMLQTAQAAEADGADAVLVGSALLHDYGHLVHELPEDSAEHGVDTLHEEAGAAWLEAHFVPRVTEPLRLHVQAKRYLCAVEPGYLGSLSGASVHSLRVQGGPMDRAEAAGFEASPWCTSALRLRRWDDAAKDPAAQVPALGYYRPLLRQLARQRAAEVARPGQ